jgi:hypothetical protein
MCVFLDRNIAFILLSISAMTLPPPWGRSLLRSHDLNPSEWFGVFVKELLGKYTIFLQGNQIFFRDILTIQLLFTIFFLCVNLQLRKLVFTANKEFS